MDTRSYWDPWHETRRLQREIDQLFVGDLAPARRWPLTGDYPPINIVRSDESQADKEKFVRTSMLRLQQQQMRLRSKLDRVYEDRLSDAISDELWTTKSGELQEELRRVRTEMERHEGASQAYETAGLQILELAQSAYSSYVTQNPREQARLVKTVVSNSTFDRGSLSPT